MSTKRFHEIASKAIARGEVDKIEVRSIKNTGFFVIDLKRKVIKIDNFLYEQLRLEAEQLLQSQQLGEIATIYGVKVVRYV